MMVAMLAERLSGTRAVARAVAGEGAADLEPTVRRWLALARKEPRPINELNRFVARLAKFSRAEIRKMRWRIVTEPGPAGDRQAESVSRGISPSRIEKPAVAAALLLCRHPCRQKRDQSRLPYPTAVSLDLRRVSL